MVEDQAADRSLVMIRTSSKGERSFAVSVRVGDTLENVMQAYRIAATVAVRAESQSRAAKPQPGGRAVARAPLTDVEPS